MPLPQHRRRCQPTRAIRHISELAASGSILGGARGSKPQEERPTRQIGSILRCRRKRPPDVEISRNTPARRVWLVRQRSPRLAVDDPTSLGDQPVERQQR